MSEEVLHPEARRRTDKQMDQSPPQALSQQMTGSPVLLLLSLPIIILFLRTFTSDLTFLR